MINQFSSKPIFGTFLISDLFNKELISTFPNNTTFLLFFKNADTLSFIKGFSFFLAQEKNKNDNNNILKINFITNNFKVDFDHSTNMPKI